MALHVSDHKKRSDLADHNIPEDLEDIAATTSVSSQAAAGRSARGINVEYLNTELLGRWAQERLTSRELMRDPRFHRDDTLSMPEHRERVMKQLQLLVDNNAIARAFPTSLGGEDNHGGNLAAFQEIIFGDPSLQIKSGVQWGLFGAAILHLGTEKHHTTFLPDIISLKDPGAFAMTEIGHGSDVDSLATTATFDQETDEFIIHTPFKAAWKQFLGNAATHGQNAVVFAQLITNNVNHGVHAFYVPIRNSDGELLPGVQSADNGIKGGLNGVDNGQLAFDQVRIPRENLLNRYGDVDREGNYSSPIDSPGRRFFTMLGTLVQGRVSLDGAAMLAGQMSSYIAIKYGLERRQFVDESGKAETVLMDYQRHQRRLVPRLAQTYAMTFAHQVLLEKFDEVFSGAHDSDQNRQDLETLAAALKPISTWNALDMLQEAREATGGQGFMAENRLVGIRQDLDIYVTFEGDNNVLLQLVGKRLLTDYANRLRANPSGVLGQNIGNMLLNKSRIRVLSQKAAGLAGAKQRGNHLLKSGVIASLLQQRIDLGISEIASQIHAASKVSRQAGVQAFNAHQNELIRIAYTYAELIQLQEFSRRVEAMTDGETKHVLSRLRDLFALTIVEKYSGFFMMHGLLSAGRAQAVGQEIKRALVDLRPHVADLVDAFGLDDELVRADIATGIELERQDEAAQYFTNQSDAGLRPIHEKELRKQSR